MRALIWAVFIAKSLCEHETLTNRQITLETDWQMAQLQSVTTWELAKLVSGSYAGCFLVNNNYRVCGVTSALGRLLGRSLTTKAAEEIAWSIS